MTRFTGVALALALVSGCAGSKKDEALSGSPNTETARDTEKGGGATQDTVGGNATPNPNNPVATPTPDRTTESQAKPGFTGSAPDTHQGQPTGGTGDTAKPLDPSANADPNSPKQQARTNGLLGASDGFDDSAVDLQFDSPDESIKTLLAADKAKLTACHKTGGGTLEITLTVDATGKVTGVKIGATSTLKDTKARTCVVAIVKKLKLEKGTKPAPIKLTFPK